MIFGFFKANPEKEARQYCRDATSIIEMVEQTYKTSLLQEIARLTRAGLEQLQISCGGDAVCVARELDRYKSLHREARRNNSQGQLTAYTLIIIHTRAAALGEPGAAVIEVIAAFLERWPAEDDDSSQGSAGGQAGVLPG